MSNQDIYNNLNIEAIDKVFNDILEEFNSVYANIRLSQKTLLEAISKILLDYTVENDILQLSDNEKKKLMRELYELIEDSISEEYEEEKKAINRSLKNTVQETHNLKYYVLSLGSQIEFKKLKSKNVDKIVNRKVNSENWSDRLWTNKSNIEIQLKKDINKFLVGNISVNKIKNIINDRFSTNASNTDRLIQTEIARVQNDISEEFWKEEGITELIYLATLDIKTCEKCQKYDGKSFDVNDKNRPAVPLHPRCRCCYVETIGDWKPKKRRDNTIIDKHVDFTDYEKWFKKSTS